MPAIRRRFRRILVLVGLILSLCLSLPSWAQFPLPLDLVEPSLQQPLVIPNLSNPLVSDWIWLDGYRLFKVAATKESLSERTQVIQASLQAIKQNYLRSGSINPQVEIKTRKNLPVISVNNQHLLTITSLDAKLRGPESTPLDEQIKTILEAALRRSLTERQPQYLRKQAIWSVVVIGLTVLGHRLIHRWQHRLRRPTKAIKAVADLSSSGGLQLPPMQFWVGFTGVFRQALSALQIALCIVGLLICLDRFPYTRPINMWLFKSLQIPFTLTLIGLFTYLLIRLTWAFVNRFALALTMTPLLTPIASQRMLLRISTIAKVTRGVAVPVWISLGGVVALILLRVNVGPLLAGVGLVGVAISLASQSIIKDALNGFLVLVEDQFGVGDVIQVGEYTGVVETLNLRMTQIRNAEGQLITIPNSEIRIVANLSSEWSRVDLNIPIPYQADVDQLLDLIQSTALTMAADSDWKSHILESPQLMGIDDFDHRGPVVKVWIKTQPLQQWAVSRELRRRLKLAFDQADITFPVSQHQLWLRR